MSFDEGSIPIVQLAWERRLGLADGAIGRAVETEPTAEPGTGTDRLVKRDDDAVTLSFIRLWGRSVLVGPGWAVDAATGCTDMELSDHATLLGLTRTHGGHGLGTASLYFADDLPLLQPASELTVSAGTPEAVRLESQCPPDDANEVGLSTLEHKFTLMHDDAPVACAAYTEWQGLLARLGVLVAPGQRRQGWGLLAASVAAHEALASGLILQWRADVSNFASNALARSLGLDWAGTQTSVRLN
ncbi:GNAT family N-acetyltransferase [Paeniglutamicibacter antarcticus]|uniref:GNAT family N-acetyltransferase n=1 Tax=Arthrobacter terrae TaxID=2935737 RepID=A0A931G874_9MICC|nr:GNAT family N-acetyltransferase [Arthrobacter terrae]MBG0739979.1 GNAT family N-acetyltransferase [Arthrobacter terrae]